MSPTEPLGKVYTPESVARTLFERAAPWLPPSNPLRVLDPAVGDGELLLPVLRWAAERGVRLEITAVDIDPAACAAVEARIRPQLGPDNVLTTLCGDALEFARTGKWGDIDLVIANPPYVRETGHRALFRRIRSGYDGAYASFYRKDCDLHHFFWVLAMDALVRRGCLAFLTPAYYLESRSARPLRAELASRGTVRSIWRAGSEQVFPDAGVEASMTVWTEGNDGGVTELHDLRTGKHASRLPEDGSEWWMAPRPDVPTTSQTIGGLFEVSEGVSTAANRLRSGAVDRVKGGVRGEGIFLLRTRELAALELEPADAERFVRRRLRAGDSQEWILLVNDRDLPCLDGSNPTPQTALERHLLRFRSVLSERAEIARNPRRSWYAVAWPRPNASEGARIATPKWAKAPSFVVPGPACVPMTDYRVLTPRTQEVAARVEAYARWLNSPQMLSWYQARLKRKGELFEFYGDALLRVPVPSPSELR